MTGRYGPTSSRTMSRALAIFAQRGSGTNYDGPTPTSPSSDPARTSFFRYYNVGGQDLSSSVALDDIAHPRAFRSRTPAPITSALTPTASTSTATTPTRRSLRPRPCLPHRAVGPSRSTRCMASSAVPGRAPLPTHDPNNGTTSSSTPHRTGRGVRGLPDREQRRSTASRCRCDYLKPRGRHASEMPFDEGRATRPSTDDARYQCAYTSRSALRNSDTVRALSTASSETPGLRKYRTRIACSTTSQAPAAGVENIDGRGHRPPSLREPGGTRREAEADVFRPDNENHNFPRVLRDTPDPSLCRRTVPPRASPSTSSSTTV